MTRARRRLSPGTWRLCCFLLLDLLVRKLLSNFSAAAAVTYATPIALVRFIGSSAYLVVRLFAGE
jgi:hypothetical protein